MVSTNNMRSADRSSGRPRWRRHHGMGALTLAGLFENTTGGSFMLEISERITGMCDRIELKILMAGDSKKGQKGLQDFCHERSLVASMTPTTFATQSGAEAGFIVAIENGIGNDGFPSSLDELLPLTKELAERLAALLSPAFYAICTPTTTYVCIHKYKEAKAGNGGSAA
jgi:hypothetical protein